jgi:hypothetical protein
MILFQQSNLLIYFHGMLDYITVYPDKKMITMPSSTKTTKSISVHNTLHIVKQIEYYTRQTSVHYLQKFIVNGQQDG